ncbi:MAG: haloalkane dehalogenase [Bacteroidia bacterium]|nr:haloalkane dehalogenase [Bacteroidia bacterium]
MSKVISSDFPFESKYLEVKGSKIHYVEEGSGDPILFLHGNPTSSYLWRNIIPYLSTKGRCIAPDLIGMGKSDKPDLNYGFFDTYEYVEAFIEKMGLRNITLVIHDWGSACGFHYANTHRDNIKGIVFMESVLDAFEWKQVPLDVRISFRIMRTAGIGWLFVNLANLFIKKMLPDLIKRELSPEEKAYYAAPYKSISSRKPLRRWPEDVPLGGRPRDVHAIVKRYNEWLQQSELPKLFFYASPGTANKTETVKWVQEHLPNTQTIYLGEGFHFVQEDHPHKIGEETANWYDSL